ncbi:LacI family DNA-binding transcriptional regulator [Microbacterium aurantiacum]|uniref:LacI family DNA-binding transcriptional regulator n=1 Tax=Microbacterium aurantiacum TaxID=162393 RepID=UPI000C807D68|nr:LacI family DNA-binding transcriptional regulator [Microbacterium aurantiacum]
MVTTMQDVARLAGVSAKTVSNVVNGTGYVSTTTRSRVESAIRSLDYKLNLAGRTLRSGRSGVIGLAVPSLSVAYFAELAERVIAAAEAFGLVVQIERTGSVDRERSFLASARVHHLDGLIFNPSDHLADELTSVALPVPTVILGEHAVGPGAVHVSSDQSAAARVATQHLLDVGRRQIVAIGARIVDPRHAASLRFAGYRHALDAAGVAFDPELVCEADPWNQMNGANAARELLATGTRFDAVVAFNDSLALGAMRALEEAGLRVPADVAIIGIDNIAESEFSIPSLSTVDLGSTQIAEEAVRALVDQLGTDGPAEPRHVVVDFRLVTRESTAAS